MILPKKLTFILICLCFLIGIAAAAEVPEITWMKTYGGDKDEQILTLYLKSGSNYKKMELEKLSFVPLVGKKGW